ncbi:MAG: hypothetical protein JXB48_19425 [Candidatus Latescibacteria bacterium]|nr:hypothetical protein [Candidatus Latescibacterota bacterium]
MFYSVKIAIRHILIKSRIVSFFFVCMIVGNNPAYACNVPVFRYALERWPADDYEVNVFYESSLSTEDKAVISWLENLSNKSNYSVKTYDITQSLPDEIGTLWRRVKNPELPFIVVRYPGIMRMAPPVLESRLSAEAAQQLVDSPLRHELTERILDGDSVVWILLECGDKVRDNAAAAMLDKQLKVMEQTLVLPNAADFSPDEFVPISPSGPELKIAFSYIRLSRGNPAEKLLIDTLMNTEPDLTEYMTYPMAFPVYGRGIVLYALIGDGINERNIRDACMFITGPCSCQIKELNPGVDLLMSVNWDAGITGQWVEELTLPPLVGLSALVGDAAEEINRNNDSSEAVNNVGNPENSTTHGDSSVVGIAEGSRLSTNDSAVKPDAQSVTAPAKSSINISEKSSGNILRNIIIALGIILAVTIALSFTLLTPRKRKYI